MAPVYSRQRHIKLLKLGALYILHKRRSLRKLKRRWWVHPIFEVRRQLGGWKTLMTVLKQDHPELYKKCCRLTPEQFDYLYNLVGAHISKSDTHMRCAITGRQRLCMTLLYLATGDSTNTVSLLFRVGLSTVRQIVLDTCKAIYTILQPIHMKTPCTENEWLAIAEGFYHSRGFPNCIGMTVIAVFVQCLF